MNRAEKRRQKKLAKKAARGVKPKKATLQRSIDLAVQHHAAGALAEAEAIYKQILRVDPNQPVALHLLGVIAYQVGKFEIAVEMIGQALAHRPNYDEAHNNLGNAQKALNNLDAAAASYAKAIAIKPDYAEAHFNLGLALSDLNKPDEAIGSYQRAIAIRPAYADAYYNLAIAHYDLNQLDKAVQSYRKVLTINPDNPQTLGNLGVALGDLDKLDEAVASFRGALTIKPDYAEAHYNLGRVLNQQNKPDQAIASYQAALAIKPDYAEAHSNLGNTLKEQNKLDAAAASYRAALAIRPQYVEVHSNLGVVLKDLYQLEQAVASLNQALAIDPQYAQAHNNLGNVLLNMGQPGQAAASYRKALDIDPDYGEAHSNLIFVQDFIADIDQNAQQAERKTWDDRFTLPHSANIKAHPNVRDPDRRLRIGYVSADFYRHSAAFGFGPLIIEHDRRNFDVFCYDATPLQDDMSAALRAADSNWRTIKNLSDAQVADIIGQDAIDILVDLSGHTSGNRLGVFAHKPAPLQISGIGHVAPGVSTIDYRLTTQWMTPPHEQDIYPESPVYLNTFFGFTAPEDAPRLVPPPCLENGYMTFGFLGRHSKITEHATALWASILTDSPDARLVLKYAQLDDPAIQQKVFDTYAGLGIAAERLTLLGKTPKFQHLEAHNRVDVVFDSLPHGGGMTTMDSLWMGVPVVGLFNPDKVGGRIIQSISAPLGLDDCVATSPDQYHDMAIKWAGQPQRLSETRARLRRQVSDVYGRFPGDVEKAYRLIWQRWCAAQPPSPLYPLG